MHLNSSPCLNGRPLLFELIHHFLPDEETLISKFLNSIFCLLLEKIESESPLNRRCFFHQKLQMLVSLSSLVHSYVFLNDGHCQDRAFRTFEHSGRNFYKFTDLVFICNAIKHFLFGGFVETFSCQLNKLSAIYISKLNIEISK